MENFKASGLYTKQAHVKIPENHYEEEHGRKGFFGRVSHLYHQNPLTNWSEIDGDLRPRNLPSLFDLKEVQNNDEVILKNFDVEISVGTYSDSPKTFLRNADFDTMYFVHEGSGAFETSYGHIPYQKGDYIILPRGVTYKFYVSAMTKFLIVDSRSEFEQPDRGMLGPMRFMTRQLFLFRRLLMEQKKQINTLLL